MEEITKYQYNQLIMHRENNKDTYYLKTYILRQENEFKIDFQIMGNKLELLNIEKNGLLLELCNVQIDSIIMKLSNDIFYIYCSVSHPEIDFEISEQFNKYILKPDVNKVLNKLEKNYTIKSRTRKLV